MRVIRSGDFKLIYNPAFGLEYPFASDLWAASTWQSIYRNKVEYFGKRTVEDYLHHAEFELYNLKLDPDESVNLATDENYKTLLDDLKNQLQTFQKDTSDPWQITWSHDASLQGNGVGL